MERIKFKKDTVYCRYQSKFVNIDLCNNHCFVLCTSNGKKQKNWQMNEEEYNKYIQENLPINDDNFIDTFGT